MRYGFHEDGFSSGLFVAQEHLGAKIPFEFKDSTYSRGRRPRRGVMDHMLRFIIWLIQVFFISVIDRVAGQLLTTRKLAARVNGAAGHQNGRIRAKKE